MSLRTNGYLILAALAFAVGGNAALADAGDWLRLKNAGEGALSVNNYGLAEKSLTEALREAEKFGPADLRLAVTLHDLGGLYSTRGQFAKAEPLYERELRVKEKALGPDHPDVVAAVGKLAEFYLNHGSPAKADRLASLLLSFADRKLKEQQGVTDSLAKLDGYYGKSHDYNEARDLLHRLQDKTQQLTANQGLELATTLDSIGNIYKGRGKYDIAERMYRNALAFREHVLSSDHLALAYSYENLANLYVAEGKSQQAEPLFKKALDITEKTLQPGRPEAYKRLDELAQSHVNMGQIAEAESLYQRALKVMDKSGGNSGDAGRASFALGSLYIKQGKYGAAEPLMRRALKVSEAVNGPQHAAVAPILDSYADVLDKLGKSGEASKLRARSRAIRGVSAQAGAQSALPIDSVKLSSAVSHVRYSVSQAPDGSDF